MGILFELYKERLMLTGDPEGLLTKVADFEKSATVERLQRFAKAIAADAAHIEAHHPEYFGALSGAQYNARTLVNEAASRALIKRAPEGLDPQKVERVLHFQGLGDFGNLSKKEAQKRLAGATIHKGGDFDPFAYSVNHYLNKTFGHSLDKEIIDARNLRAERYNRRVSGNVPPRPSAELDNDAKRAVNQFKNLTGVKELENPRTLGPNSSILQGIVNKAKDTQHIIIDDPQEREILKNMNVEHGEPFTHNGHTYGEFNLNPFASNDKIPGFDGKVPEQVEGIIFGNNPQQAQHYAKQYVKVRNDVLNKSKLDGPNLLKVYENNAKHEAYESANAVAQAKIQKGVPFTHLHAQAQANIDSSGQTLSQLQNRGHMYRGRTGNIGAYGPANIDTYSSPDHATDLTNYIEDAEHWGNRTSSNTPTEDLIFTANPGFYNPNFGSKDSAGRSIGNYPMSQRTVIDVFDKNKIERIRSAKPHAVSPARAYQGKTSVTRADGSSVLNHQEGDGPLYVGSQHDENLIPSMRSLDAERNVLGNVAGETHIGQIKLLPTGRYKMTKYVAPGTDNDELKKQMFGYAPTSVYKGI